MVHRVLSGVLHRIADTVLLQTSSTDVTGSMARDGVLVATGMAACQIGPATPEKLHTPP